jgi:hypothetical protein
VLDWARPRRFGFGWLTKDQTSGSGSGSSAGSHETWHSLHVSCGCGYVDGKQPGERGAKRNSVIVRVVVCIVRALRKEGLVRGGVECGCCRRVLAVEVQRTPDWRTIDRKKALARRGAVSNAMENITRGVGRLDGPPSVAAWSWGDTVESIGGGMWSAVGGRRAELRAAAPSWRRGNPQQQRSLLLPGPSVVSLARRAAIGENGLRRDAIKAAAVGLAHTFLALSRGRSNVGLREKQAKTAGSLAQKRDTGRRNFSGPSPKTS